MDPYSPAPIRTFLMGIMISVLTLSVPALIMTTEDLGPKYIQSKGVIQ